MICPHYGNDTEKFETSEVTVERDDQNRIKTWTEITKDQGGKQVRKRVDAYTYYPNGNVDIINMKVFKGPSTGSGPNGKLVSEKEIKYGPGQPTVRIIKEVFC